MSIRSIGIPINNFPCALNKNEPRTKRISTAAMEEGQTLYRSILALVEIDGTVGGC